ncbi:MAG: nitroreductase family protein, partial [Promethearchaeota archaeon]
MQITKRNKEGDETMTFVELLKYRRSIRNYEDKPVPEGVIKDMIKECILSPNAGNEQPWEFIIVNNKNML